MTTQQRPRHSSSQPGVWWALGWAVFGSFIALVTFAPATWLAQGLNSATGGRLQLHEARGTVWQGSARLFLTGGPGSNDQAYLPDAVRWTIRPQISSLQVNFIADCCNPKGITLTLTPGIEQLGVQVSDHESRLPATVLSALGTPWNTIGLDGSISLRSKDLQIHWAKGRLRFEGSASIAVQQASSRLTTVRPLGNYLVTIQGGAAPVMDLATLDGALQLSGKGQWTGARFRFSGQASASPEAEGSLNNLLNIIGRRKGAVSLISLG
jgi:general secretion pathway protein N